MFGRQDRSLCETSKFCPIFRQTDDKNHTIKIIVKIILGMIYYN